MSVCVFMSTCLYVGLPARLFVCMFVCKYFYLCLSNSLYKCLLFMTVSPQAISFKINIADDHATISCYEMHFSNDEAFNTFVSNYRFFLMMFR